MKDDTRRALVELGGEVLGDIIGTCCIIVIVFGAVVLASFLAGL